MKDIKMYATGMGGSKPIPDSDAVAQFREQSSQFRGRRGTQTSTQTQPQTMRRNNSTVSTKNKLNRSQRGSSKQRALFYDDTSSSPVNFRANLPLKMYVNPKESSGGRGKHKLHILAVNDFFQEFDLITEPDSLNTSWFETRNQFRQLISDIQRETNNNSYLAVSAGSFSKYFNLVSRMLDAYYSVDSILSFKPSFEEENISIEALRYQLLEYNPAIFEVQNTLRRALMNVAIPPNILEYYRWKNQAFRLSELGQSTAFKFSSAGLFPSDFNSEGKERTFMSDSTNWESYIGNLIDEFYLSNNIIAPMLKARPMWLVTDLPVSPNTTVYDTVAIDIFCNFPTFVKGKVFPDGSSNVREYMSVVNPDNQDGMIEAFVSFSANKSGFWGTEPGVIKELVNNKIKANRFLISNEESDEQWDPHVTPTVQVADVAEIGLTFNRARLKDNNEIEEYTTRHDGKIRLQVNSEEGIELNSRLFLEWLFN